MHSLFFFIVFHMKPEMNALERMFTVLQTEYHILEQQKQQQRKTVEKTTAVELHYFIVLHRKHEFQFEMDHKYVLQSLHQGHFLLIRHSPLQKGIKLSCNLKPTQ